MTNSIAFGSRRVSAKKLLLGLLTVAVAVALLTPDVESGKDNFSSYSRSAGGTRITFELAERMGWNAKRRETTLDSAPPTPNTQVVIGPQGTLGAHEVHALLENVRRGGGLVFGVDGGEEIADSLGLHLRGRERLLANYADPNCRDAGTLRERQARTLPPTINEMGWRRPAPGPVTSLASVPGVTDYMDVAIGFPLGRGRIAAVASTDVFANSAVRVCQWTADVAVVRALEFVRPPGEAEPVLVFDEFHHGYGVHGGSLAAISMFLSRTASGHFLAQALVAALILLFAAAPRPIVPRDPERIVRRSPLEHADALGHAYADVGATRTATSRLVGGLRRRAGRTVSVEPNAPDGEFLDGVVRRTPSLAPKVAVVRRGLDTSVPPRELTSVGEAIAGIEQALLTSPPAKS